MSKKPTIFRILKENQFETNEEAHVTDPDRKPIDETEIRVLITEKFNLVLEKIYGNGGIKPVNAAIDEIGKLFFLSIHAIFFPDAQILINGESYPLKSILSSKFLQNRSDSVGLIQQAFKQAIQEKTYTIGTLKGEQTFFSRDDYLKLTNQEILLEVLDIFSLVKDILLDPRLSFDALGYAYDVFLRGKYDSSGGLGTYLTPKPVVDSILDFIFFYILQAKNEKDLFTDFLAGDITCGTGRFLTGLISYINEHFNLSQDFKQKLFSQHLLGADNAISSIQKARINFLAYGIFQPKLFLTEDSIIDEHLDSYTDRFSMLLTNPPFGEGKYTSSKGLQKMRDHSQNLSLGWNWQESKQKERTRADPALLFLDRNLQLLKPGGLLGIVLPDGLVEFSNQNLREHLFGKYSPQTQRIEGGKASLKAIISLPKDTFAISGTVAKTSFVILQKNYEPSRAPDTIFFGNSHHVGFLKKGNRLVKDPLGNDLPRIFQNFCNGTITADTFFVDEAEFVVGKSVMYFHPEILDIRDKLAGAFNTVILDQFTRERPKKLGQPTCPTSAFVSVLHVDKYHSIDLSAAIKHRPRSRGKRCFPGDLIFSCINPRIFRAAVIPELPNIPEVFCSTEFAVLIPEIDPYLLLLLLSTDYAKKQIQNLTRGTSSSRQRIKHSDLLSIHIPDVPITSELKTIIDQFADNLMRLNQLRSKSDLTIEQFTEYLRETYQS